MSKKKDQTDKKKKEKKEKFEQFPDFGTMKKFVTGSDVPKEQPRRTKAHDLEDQDSTEDA